ncbi:hypothetical protein FNF27_06414 [Cafeteria roenbergensis]|uniref:TmcB/TmcC TPR repeats domain-containing protein n=3 Tax=Cafeteria roenbergensis TaxID=33653 RepID=A0A5A8E4U9_CAFRO|nr:hypothetical protein FNF27_06414 [Cafeteria roenbergensis]
MASVAAPSGGIDAALLATRRGWFGMLFLLSRESKASTAGFAVTTAADLLQLSVFPMMIAATMAQTSSFNSVAMALSIAILDVDTLFALADANSGAGRAVLFWLALAIVVVFLGMLAYVMGTIITEGRQQAIVLRALASLASVLTTVAFMPAASLMLAVFRSCGSVEALGVGCQTDGHWVVIALVVTVLTVFTAVATFFATVYIDTDLKSTALGAKVTGRVDAAMLVAKLVLVVCFTAMSLPPTVQTILAGAAALIWMFGTVFVQPHVQPMANDLAAGAAALNCWLVLAVASQLVVPTNGIETFMAVGILFAPLFGSFANSTYRSSVGQSEFVSLRSSLQADVWARHRVCLAQQLLTAGHLGAAKQGKREPSGKGTDPGSRGGSRHPHARRRRQQQAGAPARRAGIIGPSEALSSARGEAPMLRRAPTRAASLASLLAPEQLGSAVPIKVHVLADNGANDSDSDSAVPVTTADLLPGVTPEGLIRQASMAYDEMLKAWPKSAVTYSSGSIFHRAYGSTASSELTILAMARKQVGSAWDVSFLSYQRTRQLQERSGSGLSAVDRILFDEAWKSAIEDTTNSFVIQQSLYTLASESSPDAATLGRTAEELFKARTAAERRFRTMLQINPDSIMALRAYSRFCEEVLHDADRATELMNKANRIEDKHAKTNVRPLDAVVVGAAEEPLSVMDEMNAVITMTGELRRYGEITDANVATARLFGRGRSDLVGQSLASLFPEPLGSLYDAAILAYLSPHEKGEAFSRGAHVSVVQTAGGWLAPVRVSLQEGAGSELDATPSLSMVVQRAPTKRRMMVVGDAESGFPVLALDAESMALLGDEARDEDEDDCFGNDGTSHRDIDSLGNPSSETGVQGASLDWAGAGEGGYAGLSPASYVASRELPLERWLPDLARLASAALASASGATAELVVCGSVYNAEPAEARRSAREPPRDARGLDDAADLLGDTPLRGRGARARRRSESPGGLVEAASDSYDATGASVSTASSVRGPATGLPQLGTRAMLRQSADAAANPIIGGRRGSLRPKVEKEVRIRVGMQALHASVLAGKRPKQADAATTDWLVTWEPPRVRHRGGGATAAKLSTAARGGGSSPLRARGAAGRRSSISGSSVASKRAPASGHRSPGSTSSRTAPRHAGRTLLTSVRAGKAGFNQAAVARGISRSLSVQPSPEVHSARDLDGKTFSSEQAAKLGPEASPGAVGMDRLQDSQDTLTEVTARATTDDTFLVIQGTDEARHQDETRTVNGGNGGGSVTSAMASATRVTKLVVDAALAKGDPVVSRIWAMVLASLLAVIGFAITIAILLPQSNASARLLVRSNELAQRRVFDADLAANMCFQVISVSSGFTAVNEWDDLAHILDVTLTRLELAHQQLVATAQVLDGELNRFEQSRTWRVCTNSHAFHECDKYEMLSVTDLVELMLFHMRQVAGGTVEDAAGSASLNIVLANTDLSAKALIEAEEVTAHELSEGMSSRLATMTIALVTAAVAIFVLATFGTTWLMAALGRQRFRLLASVPQVPRKQLRELARQAEEAQLAFARAVGADTGDEENGMLDVEMEDEGGITGVNAASRRDLTSGPQTVAGAKHASAEMQDKRGGGVATHRARVVHVDGQSPHAPGPGKQSGRRHGQSAAGLCCCSSHSAARRRDRRVADSSCFVMRTSLQITSPLSLIGAWIAVVLVMVNTMYSDITIDAARAEKLHMYATAASALRGQLELVLLETGQRRATALTYARTNATKAIGALAKVLHGSATTNFGVELPGLSKTPSAATDQLLSVLMYDSCIVLPESGTIRDHCDSLHAEYGLRGLLSFTTAMLDDSVQMRDAFDETNATDMRTQAELAASSEAQRIIDPLRRYDNKSVMAEDLVRYLVNVTEDAATERFATAWSDIQLVLGVFAGAFVLVVWLWALPRVRKLERDRSALYSVMLSLPEDVILGTPAVTEAVIDLAERTGLSQAARALASLARSALEQSRRQYRNAAMLRLARRHPAPTAKVGTMETGEPTTGSIAFAPSASD